MLQAPKQRRRVQAWLEPLTPAAALALADQPSSMHADHPRPERNHLLAPRAPASPSRHAVGAN